MKKNYFVLATCLFATAIWSCNNNDTASGSTTDSSSTSTTTSSTTGTDTSSMNSTANNTTSSMSSTPLAKEDSMFVMEAAAGGMMEVEAGNLAQQNAMNQRVKDFGAMMVRDHGQANSELKSLASSKGMTLPSDLPADLKKHVDAMQKMTGKSFDSHYMSMMVNDHKKDISKFEKAANSAKDADLKAWAAKTLPVLKMHQDSATAINKAKM